MTLPSKQQVIIGSVAILVAFGLGRFSATHGGEVSTKSDTQKVVDKNVVTDKKTTIVKEPTGKVTTVITEETHTDTKSDVDTKTQEIIKPPPQWQVSALGGMDIHTMTPVYGVAVSKQFLGPFTAGAFGLSNGIVGVSVGMTF